jgi:hypothetical protein
MLLFLSLSAIMNEPLESTMLNLGCRCIIRIPTNCVLIPFFSKVKDIATLQNFYSTCKKSKIPLKNKINTSIILSTANVLMKYICNN